jgi:integrase
MFTDFFNETTYAESTRSRYELILKMAVAELGDLETLTAEQFRKWLFGKPTWGGAMRWLAFSCLKAYIRWSYGSHHPALKLRIKREPAAPGRALTAGQAAQLLASFDPDTPKGKRDLALCSLLLDTGLRESEVCRLDLDHLGLSERLLSVIVKGGQWEFAVYSEITAAKLADWLKVRAARHGVRNVFVSVGGNTPGAALTPSGLRRIVHYWGESLGWKKLAPHDFRRSFATLSTIGGAPSRMVQVGGRWSNILMVEHYTQRLQLEDFRKYTPVDRLKLIDP